MIDESEAVENDEDVSNGSDDLRAREDDDFIEEGGLPSKKKAGRPKKTIDFKWLTEGIIKKSVKDLASDSHISPMIKELIVEEIKSQLKIEIREIIDKNKFKIKDYVSNHLKQFNDKYAETAKNEFSENPKPRLKTPPATRQPKPIVSDVYNQG